MPGFLVSNLSATPTVFHPARERPGAWSITAADPAVRGTLKLTLRTADLTVCRHLVGVSRSTFKQPCPTDLRDLARTARRAYSLSAPTERTSNLRMVLAWRSKTCGGWREDTETLRIPSPPWPRSTAGFKFDTGVKGRLPWSTYMIDAGMGWLRICRHTGC